MCLFQNQRRVPEAGAAAPIVVDLGSSSDEVEEDETDSEQSDNDEFGLARLQKLGASVTVSRIKKAEVGDQPYASTLHPI